MRNQTYRRRLLLDYLSSSRVYSDTPDLRYGDVRHGRGVLTSSTDTASRPWAPMFSWEYKEQAQGPYASWWVVRLGFSNDEVVRPFSD